MKLRAPLALSRIFSLLLCCALVGEINACQQQLPPVVEIHPPAPPTTRYTQPLFEQSTPQATMRSLFLAVYWGFPTQVPRLCCVRTPIDQSVVQALTNYAASVDELHGAATSYFSADDALLIHPQQPDLAQVELATVDIEGNAAWVAIAGLGTIPLVRIGQDWKVDIQPYCQQMQLSEQEYVDMVGRLARVDRIAVGDIESLQLITPHAVQQFIDDADQAAADVDSTPDTMPATASRPATGNGSAASTQPSLTIH